MVLHHIFEDFEFRFVCLVLRIEILEFGNNILDDVVLLVRFQNFFFFLAFSGAFAKLRIEDRFFDLRVYGELLVDLLEEFLA